MHRRSLIPLLTLLLAIGLVACGGGSKEDPKKVLDETFQGGKDYSSGVVDAQVSTANGSANLDATLKGPFQSNPGGLPKFDLEADIKSSVSFTGGLVSTGDAAFVNVRGTDYAIDSATFGNFKQLFLNAQQQVSNPGVNPTDFMTDLSNDGTESVAGTDTIHISGSFDVAKLGALAKQAATAAGQNVPGLAQLEQSVGATKAATFDLFTGADDKRIRKLELHFSFNPVGSNQGGDVDATLTLSDLGQPQTIQAPANAKPLGDLLKQLGALGGSSAGGAGGGGAGAATPPTPPGNGQSNAYLQCLQQAKGQAAIQACAQQLQ